jgi:hypothetical protein
MLTLCLCCSDGLLATIDDASQQLALEVRMKAGGAWATAANTDNLGDTWWVPARAPGSGC